MKQTISAMVDVVLVAKLREQASKNGNTTSKEINNIVKEHFEKKEVV